MTTTSTTGPTKEESRVFGTIFLVMILSSIIYSSWLIAGGMETLANSVDRLTEESNCSDWQSFDLEKPIPENAWMFGRVIGVGFDGEHKAISLTISKCRP